MKDVQIKLIYEQADTNQEEVERRLEAAFDILFEAALTIEPNLESKDMNNRYPSVDDNRPSLAIN